MEPFKENSDLATDKSEQEVNLLEGEEAFIRPPANLPPVPQIAQSELYDSDDIGTLTNESPRFRDLGRGTVIDNNTGLIWLKNANCADSTANWYAAFEWVDELNFKGTMNGQSSGDTSNAGTHQRDWRVPNIEELQSLIDCDFRDPALSNTAGDGKWSQGDPFNNVQSYYYWSSSTNSNEPSDARVVSLDDGYMGWVDKTNVYYVWPVRGGQ